MLGRDRTKHKQLLTLILAAAVLIRIPLGLYRGDQVTVLPSIQDQVSYDALGELDIPFDTHWKQHGHGLAAETISK